MYIWTQYSVSHQPIIICCPVLIAGNSSQYRVVLGDIFKELNIFGQSPIFQTIHRSLVGKRILEFVSRTIQYFFLTDLGYFQKSAK